MFEGIKSMKSKGKYSLLGLIKTKDRTLIYVPGGNFRYVDVV